MATPIYSFEEMQYALRYVAGILSHVPSIKEYEAVREREWSAHCDAHPEEIDALISNEKPFWMPTPVTIRSRYRNWPNAIKEIKRDFPVGVKTEDITFLQSLIKLGGKPMTEKYYEEQRPSSPNAPRAVALIRQYGNWSNVLKAAGAVSTHYHYRTDEELLEMMLSLAVEIGRMPTVAEYDRARRTSERRALGWPVSRQFYRRFGPKDMKWEPKVDADTKEVIKGQTRPRLDSWITVEALLQDRIAESLGQKEYHPNPKIARKKDPLDLEFLRKVAGDLNHIPSISDYSQAREALTPAEQRAAPSSDEIKKRHNGSWKNALASAGIDDSFIFKTLQPT